MIISRFDRSYQSGFEIFECFGSIGAVEEGREVGGWVRGTVD